MRKNYRELFYLKFGARLGSSMMQSAVASISSDYTPVKSRLLRKFPKKPSLEKIGGITKKEEVILLDRQLSCPQGKRLKTHSQYKLTIDDPHIRHWLYG